MATLQIHVGGDFADTEQRVLAAVARHEAGEEVVENHLTFENWQTFARVMTANRLELLRQLHHTPPRSVLALALARALGRDYKRVHEDVEALVAAGLHADYDAIQIAM
jgi:predicted transcriptional regulator